jgi:Protein of unknown function (DUF3467)
MAPPLQGSFFFGTRVRSTGELGAPRLHNFGEQFDSFCGASILAAMSDDPVSPKLQVQIDDEVAQGVYTNLVLINHTENEFVLDFAFIQPGNARAKVRSRLISSPRHTKRLLIALQKNIERFEERFGTIESGKDDDDGPVLH